MKLNKQIDGGYRFLTGIAPYSSGVVSLPGYEIVHVTLRKPMPYRDGFGVIDQLLAAQSRPRQALCAIELRSPAPFTFAGFAEFNRGYQDILVDWALLVNGQNPIARTNVAPAVGPPDEPSLYAFSYTLPCRDEDVEPTFIIAGAGELTSSELSADYIVRAGETSVDAMRDKATQVMHIMESRLSGLGVTWSNITAVDIYTVYPLQPFIEPVILQKMGPAVIHGLRWFYSRPPIIDVEFEMDMRGVRREERY